MKESDTYEKYFMLTALGYDIVEKQDEETETEKAEKNWRENWQNILPPSGKGTFSYQHHIRGLSEEETTLPHDEIMKLKHALHGDLRLTSSDPEQLWGFNIFLGQSRENQGNSEKFLNLDQGNPLQGTYKLLSPKIWQEMGTGDGTIIEPGKPGATANKYAQVIRLDHGSYELGVGIENSLEIFLKGQYLEGRYLITSVPRDDGTRYWQISMPKDQTPLAERESLAKKVSDEQSAGRKWLYWAKPGQKPELIDLTKVKAEDFEKSYKGSRRIIEKQDEKQIVYGVVIEPMTDVTPDGDAEGHKMTAEEIEKTAHQYLEKHRKIDLRHTFKKVKAIPVESYIAPIDMTINGETIKKGSWVLAVKILDKNIWEKVKNGELNAFSPGGVGLISE